MNLLVMKVCKTCRGQNHPSSYRCRFCNVLFPEGQKIIEQRKNNRQVIKDQKVIWNAAVVLYFIGGIFSLIGVFASVMAYTRNMELLFHLPLVIGIVFIGLAVWSKSEEYWSILIGFILFSLVWLLFMYGSQFSVIIILLFLPFEIYLLLAILKIKRKTNLNTNDILDA
tara:strand:+ start:577 stop:1083 length:507 start_codon:yes stop_codon:yes gene_type:complete